MSHNQGMGLQQELHEQITEATCSLIESVQAALRASPTPGRLHYHFNLRDVARVFQVNIVGSGKYTSLPEEKSQTRSFLCKSHAGPLLAI